MTNSKNFNFYQISIVLLFAFILFHHYSLENKYFFEENNIFENEKNEKNAEYILSSNEMKLIFEVDF